ncbi:alpha-L-rhamnosidase [Neorhodopirellula lusitana]|uniref:alpha-L-rhamnosidase n=1 Tax=Neorhodopirellula lusitana TaxID=445327 RepID=A0ABY1PSK1_9BACT|nr:family 78 glycoside hydrolase catalytic domain [Neorhodopirellula lusitana]SMP43842.1 alpha-L-rhamnosidase [Neorhodopirellula lusitana]
MALRTLVLLALVCAQFAPSTQAMTPIDLRCDGNTDPIAASPTPILTWRVESAERGAQQSAWQVIVASTPELLSQGKGDLWDSGKVTAKRSPQVLYAGKPLPAGQRCHWQVRCWGTDAKSDGNENDEASWSKPAFWENSLHSPSDWRGAQWIDDGKALPTNDAGFYEHDPAPRMRYEFSLDKPIVSARLHVAGLGYFAASLNGAHVGDHELDSVWTAFDKRILFSSFDVTDQLQSGDNCIGVELGNGWFNPLPLRMWGHRNIRGSIETGRPRAIACLIVDHEDGTQSTITTGPDWKFTPGPTLFNSVYLGEVVDARLDQPGWNTPNFDSADWKPVQPVDASLEPLQPLTTPPIRAAESIDAVAITQPEPGIQIVDFGQNFTGVPEITLNAPAGTKVQFRFGELLYPDGTLNPMTSVCGQIKGNRKLADGTLISKGGPGAPEFAWQADRYTCRGGGPETYRPKFTFHGFRFMEVTGLPQSADSSPLSLADMKGIPLRSDLLSNGEFSCSNELFNSIQEVTRQTFLANVVGVQSDCPHRERFGYGGDIAATSEAFLMNFDMSGFYAKTVRDWDDAARPDGNLTDTAPFVGINYCGVGWAMAHPLLIEQLYQHYGDESLVEDQLPVAIRWLELENSARKKGLVTKGLGDHEALTRSGGPVITTAMFVDAARRVARLARVVGRDSDADRFETMADDAAEAWADSFLDIPSGKVDDGSQTRQSLALGFGTATNSNRQAIFDQMVSAIQTPTKISKAGTNKPVGPHLTTGIFGTRMVMEELSKNSRTDLAYELADRDTFPSWGWMLKNDATTLWEHWAGSDGTFSNNHPMFGSVSAWFFRWLGGIQISPDAVGADRLVICPQIVPDLDWVKCSHKTVRGLVESNWKATSDSIDLDIVIPPDTTAVVEFPIASNSVTESGQPLDDANGIEILNPGRRIQIGSGHYQFKIPKSN